MHNKWNKILFSSSAKNLYGNGEHFGYKVSCIVHALQVKDTIRVWHVSSFSVDVFSNQYNES